ncbi:hypothetical protein BD626DRAFT_161500 [Schizophyllum amplum]|uniref:Uncharacterized protein n=1 Tax=Schizophyllum amplum TaxID=97359 RepID=A0A550CP80_9AGAR|nr:hypothetical protein BD626DRAFT_161500 [Auriculariopsis ampla]
MPHDKAQDVLRNAQRGDQDLAISLSELLKILCQDRAQPLNEASVSQSACRRLLDERPDIQSLLKTSIQSLNYDLLWTSVLSTFEGNKNLPSPTPTCQDDVAVEEKISIFVDKFGKLLADYARSDAELRAWVPDAEVNPDAPTAYINFITSLRIPDTGNNCPSLILHHLGDLFESQSLAARLQNIFQPGKHTMFINSSATGKTRLALEGLSRSWGLYLPCAGQPTGLGSPELFVQLQLNRFAKPTPGLPPEVRKTQVASNAHIARRLAAQVMLARLTIFKIYLESLPDVRDVKHRRRWLLLQVAPSALVRREPFRDLAFRLHDTGDGSLRYIERRIADTLLEVRSLLGPNEPIYCVVDDAQNVGEYHADRFGRSTALREIARCWEKFEGLTLVLCGLPYNLTPFRQQAERQYDLCTDTGSFDNRDDHAAYVRRYLPPDLVESDSGRKLIDRICIWLRARYRLTATFINCLISARFMSPHTLLTAYVATHTSIEPGDSPRRMKMLVRQDCNRLVYGLGQYEPRSVLQRDSEAVFTAQMVMHRMIALGQESVRITDDCIHLVSLGFARFSNADGTEVIVDEPFFVFPLLDMQFRRWGPIFGFLNTPRASSLKKLPLQLPFHLAVITLLVLALKESRPLSDLFTLDESIYPWAKQSCTLVCISKKPDGELCTRPYNSSFPEEDTTEPWATESADWLQHTTAEPVCVASGFSHADLIFALQLANGDLLYVTLKIMVKNKAIRVSAQEIEQILTRLAPEHLFEVPNAPVDTYPRFLDLPTANASSSRVLRAFATFPKETNVRALQPDCFPHPIAALNLKALQASSESIPYVPIMRRVSSALITSRLKRWVGGNSLSVEEEESYY